MSSIEAALERIQKFLAPTTVKKIRVCLLNLAKEADLSKPDKVIQVINNLPGSFIRRRYRWAYRRYAEVLNMEVNF